MLWNPGYSSEKGENYPDWDIAGDDLAPLRCGRGAGESAPDPASFSLFALRGGESARRTSGSSDALSRGVGTFRLRDGGGAEGLGEAG
jgi:hypothetical protein